MGTRFFALEVTGQEVYPSESKEDNDRVVEVRSERRSYDRSHPLSTSREACRMFTRSLRL